MWEVLALRTRSIVLGVDAEGCAVVASWVSAPACCSSALARCSSVRCVLPLSPVSFCPWAQWDSSQRFHTCVWKDCEDAEPWDSSCTFGSRGSPLTSRGSVTRSTLQYQTPGDSSEPPFRQGLSLYSSGNVWSRRWPQQQQQQPPMPCAKRPASSRQGLDVRIFHGIGACSLWKFR